MRNKQFNVEKFDYKEATIIGLIMMFGTFVGSLAATLVSPALPTIMEDFSITPASGQWLTTVYMLVLGVMIPLTAYLVNRFTTRQLFITCVGVFSLGSAIALTGHSFEVLLFARVLQAIGAGILLPLLQVTVLTIFPPEKRGFAMSIVGVTIGVAPAIGPTLSGYLVDAYGWHSLFLVTLVLGIIDLVAAVFFLRNIGKVGKGKFDLPSLIMSIVGFGGTLIGFSNIGNYGLTSANVIVPMIVGGITLYMFFRRQLVLDEPLLEVRVFKNRRFTISTILVSIVYGSMMSATIIVPMYVQDIRGYSALTSGLLILPGAIIMLLFNPVAGKILDKYGGRILFIVGMTLLLIGNLGFILLDESISLLFLTIAYGFRMLGVSCLLMPLTAWGVKSIPVDYMSHASALNTTLRQVSGAIGSAIFVSIMVKASTLGVYNSPIMNNIFGVEVSFMAVSVLSLIGLIITIIYGKDKKAGC
ncbi:MAG: MDR family MFS transporter [Clostridium sp.]|uniref:MDR family MFS transporter n=1 Tax=Clostridium sp. TaxID=1506 RepID=UPI002FC93FAD